VDAQEIKPNDGIPDTKKTVENWFMSFTNCQQINDVSSEYKQRENLYISRTFNKGVHHEHD